MTVERAQIAPLMLGDIVFGKVPGEGKVIQKFSEAEAANALEAAAMRLGVTLTGDQMRALRKVQGLDS
ncbi:MAG TPA: hypothetical protein DEQ40_00435 [Oxalobacteraceae bacterium]|nr:hypothetical protein [Oxalobacteraceae bacterium]